MSLISRNRRIAESPSRHRGALCAVSSSREACPHHEVCAIRRAMRSPPCLLCFAAVFALCYCACCVAITSHSVLCFCAYERAVLIVNAIDDSHLFQIDVSQEEKEQRIGPDEVGVGSSHFTPLLHFDKGLFHCTFTKCSFQRRLVRNGLFGEFRVNGNH
jgi:hypothetical protein